jgi:t-SNARE complex subunit (syntaxin)
MSRQVEVQLTELTQATHFIAEEVETQAESVNSILNLTMESRDNFARGNSNLRAVTASSSDFRLCVLVLVIFLTFSLLFLHWVYP